MTEPSPSDPRADVRILLVEDDDAFRRFLAGALEKAGFALTPVATGEEALQRIREECYELMLCDLVLPDMDGARLAAQSKEICPDTALIFMSGYEADDLRRRDITQVVFIPKPFKVSYLVDTIDRTLELEG